MRWAFSCWCRWTRERSEIVKLGRELIFGIDFCKTNEKGTIIIVPINLANLLVIFGIRNKTLAPLK
jgi:hypothetical protein